MDKKLKLTINSSMLSRLLVELSFYMRNWFLKFYDGVPVGFVILFIECAGTS